MADHDIVVIGGGPAGLGAAVEAARGGADVELYEGEPLLGGLVANVGRLDDWPSPGAVSGSSLAEALGQQARDAGARVLTARVDTLRRSGRGFEIRAGGKVVTCAGVVVATGGSLRRLGVPGEIELTGRGVSTCDWCDGGLYRGKDVAVIGGGNAALQAALHLADLCRTVTIVVRSAELRARRDYVLRAADVAHIEFLWETKVTRFVGTDALEGLVIESAHSPPAQRGSEGAFVFAGLEPRLDFMDLVLERTRDGRLVTDSDGATSCPGLVVAGAAFRSGSALQAMAEGARAADALMRYLQYGESGSPA